MDLGIARKVVANGKAILGSTRSGNHTKFGRFSTREKSIVICKITKIFVIFSYT